MARNVREGCAEREQITVAACSSGVKSLGDSDCGLVRTV